MSANAKPPTRGRATISPKGEINLHARRTDDLEYTGARDGDLQHSLITQAIECLWLPAALSQEQREVKINAALAALEGLAPRDEAEGLLAAQMVATHHAAMECYRRAMIVEQSFEGRESCLKHAVRLTKAYADQLAALNKHRGRGQQKITVEHVTVEAGGQAIVGSVDAANATRHTKAGAPARTDHDRPDLHCNGEPDRRGAVAYQPGDIVETAADNDRALQAPACGDGRAPSHGAD